MRYRAHVAFSTAYDLMKNLEQVHNRRKALDLRERRLRLQPVLRVAGEGAQNELDTPRRSQPGRQPADNNRSRTRATCGTGRGSSSPTPISSRELADLTRTANRANVTIYTIDPRGLVGGPDLDENVDPTEWQDYVRKSQDSLRVLAEQTGGIAVVNQNDFDKALKRIDAETQRLLRARLLLEQPGPAEEEPVRSR